ncbi:hypothetical protein DM860_010980 [Cuscuta australis]|uniref:Uncharacterized protein n=1 Tax=Cuscuta australis TaxID=267555 RepID=A0A328E461_9ASTE|nr:hypothetical protein DM860_010980 [Cuscuta australis]
MENTSVVPYDKLDGLARWFGSSVAAAFFSSLERFSCVNLATYDTDDEEEESDSAAVAVSEGNNPSLGVPDPNNVSAASITAVPASVENNRA